jgi:hypothetical protein
LPTVLYGFDTIKHLKNAGDPYSVEDLGSALFVFEDASVLEKAEMPRNGWHFRADHFGQFADAAFAAGEFVENEKACCVR